MARAALIAEEKISKKIGNTSFYKTKLATALFYAENILPKSAALAQASTFGADSVLYIAPEAF